MAVLAHYSPEDIQIILGGIKIEGFMDRQIITIRKEEPNFKSRTSSDGKSVRSSIGNELYEVRFYLSGVSESNLKMNYLSTLDKAIFMGRLPLLIKDSLGSTFFFSSSTWIEGSPTVSLGTSIEEREWILKCDEVQFVVGGNFEVSSNVEDLFRGLFSGIPSLRGLLS